MSRKRTVKITLKQTPNDKLSAWAVNTIVPAGKHILCIALPGI